MKTNYKVRKFKTMRGFLKSCGCKTVRASEFFDVDGGVLCSTKKGGDYVFYYAQPSPELRAAKAKEFEKCHWRKSDMSRLVALSTGLDADFSYLQCFYVGVSAWGGTSLSGESYDYCRRKFTHSAK